MTQNKYLAKFFKKYPATFKVIWVRKRTNAGFNCVREVRTSKRKAKEKTKGYEKKKDKKKGGEEKKTMAAVETVSGEKKRLDGIGPR